MFDIDAIHKCKIDGYKEYGLGDIFFIQDAKCKKDGFFSAYRSINDFRQHFVAPFIMPLNNLTMALHAVSYLVGNALLAIIDLGFLRFGDAFRNTKDAGQNLVHFVYGAYSFIIDTLKAVVSLITRFLSTLVSGVTCGRCLGGRTVDINQARLDHIEDGRRDMVRQFGEVFDVGSNDMQMSI